MQAFTVVRGKTFALPAANVDTDQIIPARFMKGTSRKLGKHLFADWRYNDDGTPKPDFVLNQKEAEGAQVLVAGDNFGCGSSREHAPWALDDWGIRAVISTSFADIFRNNSENYGLLPVIIDQESHAEAMEAARAWAEVTLDLPNQILTLPSGKKVGFPIDVFSKKCLVQGLTKLDYIRTHEKAISAYEAKRA